MVKNIGSSDEFKQSVGTAVYSLVAFYAQWNGACKIMAPQLEKLSNTYANSSINFFKVDADELEDIASEAGVQAYPVYYVYSWGRVIDSRTTTSVDSLEALIKKYHNVPLPPKPIDPEREVVYTLDS
jgi:thioredoxin 1